MVIRAALVVLGGVFTVFYFFIVLLEVIARSGWSVPLVVPLVVATSTMGFVIRRKLVGDTFPLIGIGFYTLVGYLIASTDIVYPSDPDLYGITLFVVAIGAGLIWLASTTVKILLRKVLKRSRSRFLDTWLSGSQIAAILYGVVTLQRFRKGLRFGLSGAAGLLVPLLFYLAGIDFPMLDATSLSVTSLIALLPYHSRVAYQEIHEAKEAIEIDTSPLGAEGVFGEYRSSVGLPFFDFSVRLPDISKVAVGERLRMTPGRVVGTVQSRLISPLAKIRRFPPWSDSED